MHLFRYGGVDVIGYSPDGLFTILDAKRWVGNVDVGTIRKLQGAMSDVEAKKGILSMTGSFTEPCFAYAKRNNIELWDKKRLAEMLSR